MARQPNRPSRAVPAFLITAGILLMGLHLSRRGLGPWPTNLAMSGSTATSTSGPTVTPEPIVPTRTPTPLVASRQPPTDPPEPTATTPITLVSTAVVQTFMTDPEPTISATPALPTVEPLPAISLLSRFGVTGSSRHIANARTAGLQFGSWLDWRINPAPPAVPETDYWQMVRVQETGVVPAWSELAAVAAARPGAIWLIGNEPDVKWQDNVTPERYAVLYHDAYSFIKEHDPTARIAIGGVSQPTPLRRAYLDIVLETYRATYGVPMPIDIWNVHAFVLREEEGSWGVDIPPGMTAEGAIPYEIEDHDNVEIFRQNLIDFRAWMASRGYGDRPLLVSEYGILLPADYGFSSDVVANFMAATFDFFLTAADSTGYPADNGRLVQWWFWYSLYDGSQYPTGNLFEPQTGQLTPLGEAWNNYFNR